jgi:hypothetical protein
MWLLVRFGLAAIGWGVRWYQLTRHAGGGIPVQHGESTFRLVQRRRKGGVASSALVAEVDWETGFSIRLEKWWDRLFKSFGLVREYEHGDEDFDRRVFIECDNEEVVRALIGDSAAREAIVRAFSRGATRIVCERGQLALRWPGGEDRGFAEILHDLLADWRQRQAIRQAPPDPFIWRALVIECGLWSLGAYSIGALIEQVITTFPYPASWSAIAWQGLGLAVMVYTALLGMTHLTMHGTSRGSTILAEVAIAGALIAPIFSILTVNDVNIAWDDARPIVVEAEVTNTDVVRHRSRRGGTSYSYYIEIDNLRAPGLQPTLDVTELRQRIQVPYSLYQTAAVGRSAELIVHRGALGHVWVSDLRVGVTKTPGLPIEP